jgi:prepilin-type N-terminal cleavage/methylation domain-containing protein
MPRRTGFTIIELLVVITIIAILVGLSFPALLLMKKMSQQRQAESLMMTVHGGLVKYRELFGRLPPVRAQADYLAGNNLAHYLCHPTPNAALLQTDILIDDLKQSQLRDRDSDGLRDDIIDDYRTQDHPDGRALIYVEYSNPANPKRPILPGAADEVPLDQLSSDIWSQPFLGYRKSFELWSAGVDGGFDALRSHPLNEDNVTATKPFGPLSDL